VAALKPGGADRIFASNVGGCVTTVPVHAGDDIGPGLLRRIERDLEPCLGKGWLKKS
jgi:predicted RNA binding protein YcfA (HicA-like mRNA interferase family)